jgi:hypothetical protein
LRGPLQKERHLLASDEDICLHTVKVCCNGSVTEAGQVNCRLMQSPCTVRSIYKSDLKIEDDFLAEISCHM